MHLKTEHMKIQSKGKSTKRWRRKAAVNDETTEDGIVKKLFLKCEECEEITEVVFEKNDTSKSDYADHR